MKCRMRVTALRRRFLLCGVLQKTPVPVGDAEKVEHLSRNTLDVHLVDVDAAHGEGVRQRVQEAGSIRSPDLHGREPWGVPVPEADLDRTRRRAGNDGHLEGLHEAQMNPLAGFEVSSVRDEVQLRAELVFEGDRVRDSAFPWPHPEHVDDSARRALRPRSPASSRGRGRGIGSGDERVDVAGLDVEAASGEETAEYGQLGEVVEGHDGHVVPSLLAGRDGQACPALGPELRRQPRVKGDVLGLLPLEVGGVELGQEREEGAFRDALALAGERRPDSIHDGRLDGHEPDYTRALLPKKQAQADPRTGLRMVYPRGTDAEREEAPVTTRTSAPIAHGVPNTSPPCRGRKEVEVLLREPPPARPRSRASYGLLLLLMASTLTWSQTTAPAPNPGLDRQASPRLGPGVWTRTELFFGSAQPDGSTVSEQEFRQFLDQEVTPRFPDGLTLLVGLGQFRHASGVVVQERSMLLVLLYPSNEPDRVGRIEAIRDAYKRRFQQESVLRLDTTAQVSF